MPFAVTQLEQDKPRKVWKFYLISSLSLLLAVLLVVVGIYYWDEIQDARTLQSLGYVGAFFVSLLAGMTVIPAPALPVTFTLGRVLNPLYVGLVAGFGDAIGGITVYLTGAGVGSAWTKLRLKAQDSEGQADPGYDLVKPVQSRFWSRSEAMYNRMAGWIGGRGGNLVVFIAAATPLISLFYPAAIAAGSLKMGLLRFFLVSWAGKTVKGLIVAFAGFWGLYFLPQWLGG